MKKVMLVLKKEWMGFAGSDRGQYLMYLMLVLSWGFLLAKWKERASIVAPLWLAMFSVIISATFSNTVFVAERISGSLEIILTSGISRRAILYGKMAFVFCMTLIVGAACVACAMLLNPLLEPAPQAAGAIVSGAGCMLYAASTALNAASSAYFSVKLPNPRMLHFVNLLLVSFVISAGLVCETVFPIPSFIVPCVLVALGAFFAVLAEREFDSERILKPVVL